jgi:endonuclease III-like uncharacterized protein
MVKGEKSINSARFYDEKAKNLRLKLKFINPFHNFENLKMEKKINLF